MALLDFLKPSKSKKGPNDVNNFLSDADKVYNTGPQIEHARKMAESLLKQKPEIRHWTQGAAYLMDTLAGIRYQNIAGQSENNQTNITGDEGSGPEAAGSASRPTASIPPQQPPMQPDPAQQPPPRPVPMPQKVTQNPNALPPGVSLGQPPEGMPSQEIPPQPGEIPPQAVPPADAMPAGGVPAMPGKEPPVNPFNLAAKRPPQPAVPAEAEGWKPIIKPVFNDKAPYNKRVRKVEDVQNIVVHHDQATDAEGLAKYGHKIQKGRGFDPGYHYYVDREGNVVQGVPEDRVANHALPGFGKMGKGVNNKNSIGIVMIGADGKKNEPTEKQLQAAKFVAEKVSAERGIKPERIFGHGQVNPGHRGAEEGMPLVRAMQAKKEAPAMALGGPQQPPAMKPPIVTGTPGTDPLAGQPGGPEDERQAVRVAQAGGQVPGGPAVGEGMAQPAGAQPTVRQAPVSGPTMDLKALEKAIKLNPAQMGPLLQDYIKTLQPQHRDMDRNEQTTLPGTAQRPPMYQNNLSVKGPDVKSDSAATMLEQGPNGPQYVPAIGANFGSTDKKPDFGTQAGGDPAKPAADPMDRAAGIMHKMAQIKAGNVAEGTRTEFSQGIVNDLRKKGFDSTGRIRDLDLVSGINFSNGGLLPSGKHWKAEQSVRQTLGRILKMGDAEVDALKESELKEKLLARMSVMGDEALSGRGSNLRLSMIESANPNMANSTAGGNLIAQVVRQSETLNRKLGAIVSQMTGPEANNIDKVYADFYKANPIKVEIGGKQVYIGNYDTPDEMKKVVPKGGYFISPTTGKMIQRHD